MACGGLGRRWWGGVMNVVVVNMRVARIWFDMFTRRQRRQRIREIVLVLGHALNRDGESRLCQSAPHGYR